MLPGYPFYQVDAFADAAFFGNPACVVILPEFLADSLLQKIAFENNVSETAFLVHEAGETWHLRWFTPVMEVPLCGHATLASAHVLFEAGYQPGGSICFRTARSGDLHARRCPDGRIEMDFPPAEFRVSEVDEDIVRALGTRPSRLWTGMFCAALFESAETVRALDPDFALLGSLGPGEGGWRPGNFGCFARSGDGADIVSRFFAPGSGIDEDPATGSWHVLLAGILAQEFGMQTADCFQAFPGRGARIRVSVHDRHVCLSGHAITLIEGVFRLQGGISQPF